MIYTIVFSEKAIKTLKKLPKNIAEKIVDRIEKLATNPLPVGYKKLVGSADNLYRIRQGDYRIIYTINNQKINITVLKIGHRSNIYE